MFPIIIFGAIFIIGGAVIAWKSSGTIDKIVYRVTASEEQRTLDYEKKQHDFTILKRGAWDNTYAWIFGEEAYAQTFKNKAKPQKILTGETKQTLTQFQSNKFSNKRSKRQQNG